MAPSEGTASVEVGLLRDLLTVDREAAGERRHAQAQGPLKSIDYSMPLRTRLKRRWRSDRRLRVTCWSSCLALLALLVLGKVALSDLPPALAASAPAQAPAAAPAHAAAAAPTVGPQAQRSSQTVAGPSVQPAAQLAAQPVAQPAKEPSVVAPTPAAEPGIAALSARVRLQRADLWLRVEGERGAREARALLESALAELPRSAHGYAALAQACLRLGDAVCARDAVQQATQLRPWRGGYRLLARHIAATFEGRAE